MGDLLLKPLALLAELALLPACISAPPRVTFASQEGQTRADLRGVHAVSPEVCWASGSGGTFLRTVDGGTTWISGVVPGAEELDFRDVEALDADRAFLVSAGRPAQIWATGDGGESWELRVSIDLEGAFLDALEFDEDGKHGLAWGDPLQGHFLTLFTEDGGASWQRIGERLPTPLPGEAGFAASGTCLALRWPRIWIGTGGGAARILYSEDGGTSWEVAPTPIQQGEASRGIFSVAFLDDEHGVIVGGDYASPSTTHATAALSEDGGVTWRLARGRPSYRSCVAVLPLGKPSWLLAVGSEGADISTDAGALWTAIDLPGHAAIDFAPGPWLGGRAVGWGVAGGGTVTRVEVWP